MAKRDFQVLVIGSGPGGYVTAIRAAQLGFKVACIEKGDTLGGSCLNVGCIPSKALLQSTEYFDWLNKSAKEHGISASQIQIDFKQLMQRKAGIVKGLVDSIAVLFKNHKIEWLQGEGLFLDPYTIQVTKGKEQKKVSADHIIIATGSESISLPFLPIDETRVVSSTGALSLVAIPKRLLVIGAGAIGLELASVYRRLGSDITIVEMLENIAPGMDLSASKALQLSLKKQGMNFFLGTKVTNATIAPDSLTIAVEQDNKSQSFTADVVLVAIGRRPYTKNLALDVAGVALTAKGFISIDSQFRTSQPHIYAIGDVIEGPMLAHKATHEGIVVAELIAGTSSKINYMTVPNVVYTHPEVAAVGFTEQEALSAGLQLITGTSYFRGNPRARCAGDTEGFVKVIGEAQTHRLIGMHIVGAHASELIAEGMLALQKNATLEDLAQACNAHPTLSEAIMEACEGALGHAIHG